MTLLFIGVRVAERSKACVSHARGHRFEPRMNLLQKIKKKRFFLNNWRQKFSKSGALASLVIALLRGRIERKQNSIVCQKTSYFLHSMLRKLAIFCIVCPENQFGKPAKTN